MAKRRNSRRRQTSRRPARQTWGTRARGGSGGNRRRTAARSRGRARQQTVRVVIEQAAPYTGAMQVPSALPTLPGSQVTVGRKRKF